MLASRPPAGHNLVLGRAVGMGRARGRGETGMHLILLALGAVVGRLGLVLVASGSPFDAAALGHTFIIAGTIAIVGGVGLIAMASALRQLRRIAQALEARGPPRAVGVEPAEAEPRAPMPLLPPSAPVAPRAEAEPERAEPGRAEPERAEPARAAPPVAPPVELAGPRVGEPAIAADHEA